MVSNKEESQWPSEGRVDSSFSRGWVSRNDLNRIYQNISTIDAYKVNSTMATLSQRFPNHDNGFFSFCFLSIISMIERMQSDIELACQAVKP